MKKAVEVAYITDSHNAVIGHVGCVCVASTWGPAVDNSDWFVA